jgi:hypothetical protein
MKAKDIQVGSKCHWFDDKSITGIVRSNISRQGDEVCIVEWDEYGTCEVEAVNVNDIVIINPPCRKDFKHTKPCGPSEDGDEMSCACGCAADDVFCS